MTQPSLEDWTFHAQTNIIKKKKSLSSSEFQRINCALYKQMDLLDLKLRAFSDCFLPESQTCFSLKNQTDFS